MTAAQFKIEKKIPVPERRRRYPFAEMAVGDSFFIDCGGDRNKMRAAAMNAAGAARKIKVRTRSVDGGVRVWRVA